jgi:hypothetical protein
MKLNDFLHLGDLDNVKIRFNLQFKGNWNPIEFYKNGDIQTMLDGQYHNYKKNRSYKLGQISIGFVKIKKDEDRWLLFHIGEVTKDLNKFDGVGYEYKPLTEYDGLIGKLVIEFKNNSQSLVRRATSVIDQCVVWQYTQESFYDDAFPGYDKVNISWSEMSRLLKKDSWKTALQNQKGVYLITDSSNGKMYVGSAYGEDMILGRWMSYLEKGHGQNVAFKRLTFEYIKQNFRYSILDIFKSTTDDQIIINRETLFKEQFLTRQFGYNEN